jgi:hypothetical protein
MNNLKKVQFPYLKNFKDYLIYFFCNFDFDSNSNERLISWSTFCACFHPNSAHLDPGHKNLNPKPGTANWGTYQHWFIL